MKFVLQARQLVRLQSTQAGLKREQLTHVVDTNLILVMQVVHCVSLHYKQRLNLVLHILQVCVLLSA